jgi:hypothetical protein
MEECIVCFEERDPIAFPCGHKVCGVCYPKLKRCPLCNYEIITDVTVVTPRVSHTVRNTPDRDTKMLQFACCFILIAIILLAVHNFH